MIATNVKQLIDEIRHGKRCVNQIKETEIVVVQNAKTKKRRFNNTGRRFIN